MAYQSYNTYLDRMTQFPQCLLSCLQSFRFASRNMGQNGNYCWCRIWSDTVPWLWRRLEKRDNFFVLTFWTTGMEIVLPLMSCHRSKMLVACQKGPIWLHSPRSEIKSDFIKQIFQLLHCTGHSAEGTQGICMEQAHPQVTVLVHLGVNESSAASPTPHLSGILEWNHPVLVNNTHKQSSDVCPGTKLLLSFCHILGFK